MGALQAPCSAPTLDQALPRVAARAQDAQVLALDWSDFEDVTTTGLVIPGDVSPIP